MLAALYGADGDCIGDGPRLEARFDYKQSTDFLQHRHFVNG